MHKTQQVDRPRRVSIRRAAPRPFAASSFANVLLNLHPLPSARGEVAFSIRRTRNANESDGSGGRGCARCSGSGAGPGQQRADLRRTERVRRGRGGEGRRHERSAGWRRQLDPRRQPRRWVRRKPGAPERERAVANAHAERGLELRHSRPRGCRQRALRGLPGRVRDGDGQHHAGRRQRDRHVRGLAEQRSVAWRALG